MSLILALLLATQVNAADPAVEKGVRFLKSKAERLGEARDVVLWTLVGVQVPESDPLLQTLLKDLLARPLVATRSVALEAMTLQALDPVKYAARIGQCAQFLIDNQGADGQWDGGRAVPLEDFVPPQPKFPRVPGTFGAPAPVWPKVLLQKRREGPEKGNAADSRWAAWGLLAAHRIGCIPPMDLNRKAEAAWRSADGDPAEVVSCLSIYLYFQEKNWKKDPDVLKAIERLANSQRPADPVSLSVLKVAMIHADADKLGGCDWWSDGIKTLKAAQAADGSWGSIEDTCAAIRFLHVYRGRCSGK
jgi:hypothetical protein